MAEHFRPTSGQSICTQKCGVPTQRHLGLRVRSSLRLQEATGQKGGQAWAGIWSGAATHLPLASAGQWLSWQCPSYFSIHL